MEGHADAPCPNCDNPVNDRPRAGGVTVCLNCGAWLIPDGDTKLRGFDEASYRKALSGAGFRATPEGINYAGAIAVVVWLSALTGMVYGPMAAFLVEMFPAPIRSTSLSLPYHLGVGLLGGFLPFVASALVVYYGSIFAGLWYPTTIALATAAIGIVFLPETKDRQIR